MKYIITSLMLIFFVTNINAQTPDKLSWQGILSDDQGNPLNGVYDIEVKIYNSETGGTALWSETQGVSIENGQTDLILGKYNTLNLDFDETYWLELTVDNGTPLSRMQLTSVPYAMTAKNLEDEAVSYSKLQNASGDSGTILMWDGSQWLETTESDPVYTGDPASGITNTNISNWNTAYGWGDHSQEGYLKSENDPTWGGDVNQTGSISREGNIGIGTSTPTALLHTSGTYTGEGNILFEGVLKFNNQGDPPASGSGTRMMWYPDKASFRAGYVTGTNWDKDSIGIISFATGVNTKASGNSSIAMGYGTTASDSYSTAMGFETTASGYNSTAIGRSTTASGYYSTAMGRSTTASGYISTAIGQSTTASGYYSTAMGYVTDAPSYNEFVVGSYNDDYTPNSSISWTSYDRLFVIGNGTSSNDKSNALTVLKNGRIGLQDEVTPLYAFELTNNSNYYIGRARAYAWDTYSDGRLKTDRNKIPYGLNEIMKIEPIKYFHHHSSEENGELKIMEEGTYDIGFIAQDMYKIIPEIVTKPENEESELWGMNYEKLTPVLVKAVQEQQDIIERQNELNNSQEETIKNQQKEIDELKQRLDEIEKLIR